MKYIINDNWLDKALENNLFFSDSTKVKIQGYEKKYDFLYKYCKNHEYCLGIAIPKEDEKVIKNECFLCVGENLDSLIKEEDIFKDDKLKDKNYLLLLRKFKEILYFNEMIISLKYKNGKYTIINEIQGDWKNVKNKCRTTVNKEYSNVEATEEFKNKLLMSEHSPIRLINIDWSWKGIPYWVSTELSRHKNEKFISSQRTDRTGIDRNELPQKAPVNFDGYANAQNIIDISRKRLCYFATKECRELIGDLKLTLKDNNCILADYMCPNCIYRGGCPEFKSCGFWEKFCERNQDKNLLDLKVRYKIYNKEFYPNENL